MSYATFPLQYNQFRVHRGDSRAFMLNLPSSRNLTGSDSVMNESETSINHNMNTAERSVPRLDPRWFTLIQMKQVFVSWSGQLLSDRFGRSINTLIGRQSGVGKSSLISRVAGSSNTVTSCHTRFNYN